MRLGVPRCVQLVQGLDDEAVGSQDAHPVAVRGMELDASFRPPHSSYVGLRSPQVLTGIAALFGDAQGHQHAVGQEDEAAPRPQQPRCLRDPQLGVAPDARSVLAHRQVEGVVGQGYVMGTGLDERERQPEVFLAAPGSRELGWCEVDGNGARASAGQPGREVRRPAAELDDIAPVHLAQCPQAPVGYGEQSPGDFVRRPRPSSVRVRELGVDRSPQRAVDVEGILLAVARRRRGVVAQDDEASESSSASMSADASALTACRAIRW
jgi:hypothetical protein